MPRISITAGPTANNGRRASTQYGRRLDESAAAATYFVSQNIYKIVMTVLYTDVNGGLNITGALDELFQKIPLGSQMTVAKVKVLTAFAGGTSIAVGTHQPSGTVIDVDGLVTATQGAVANLTANAYITGTGAQIGASPGLATDAVVSITAVGTFTAGELSLEVEYEKPTDLHQTMNG